MPPVLAQVVMERSSGLPADRVVNTFDFITAGADATQGSLNNISGALFRFYTDPSSAGGLTVADVISDTVVRALTTIRFYNLNDPKPRAPIFIETSFTWGDSGGPEFPGETCVVLNWRGELVSGANPDRRRGHVKIGPLAESTGAHDGNGFSRPSGATQQCLVEAAQRLMDEPDNDRLGVPAGDEFTWVVRSDQARDNSVSTGSPGDVGFVPYRDRPLLAAVSTPIVHAWTDDAWDTLRKRGVAPTGRVTADITTI